MIPLAQLHAEQRFSTKIHLRRCSLYIVVMYIVTRNSRCIVHLNSIFRLIDAWGGVDNLELILEAAKYRLCSRISLESASQPAQEFSIRIAEWLLSASDSRQSGVSFYSICDCELSQLAERGVRRKSRGNFSTASKFTLPQRLALSRPGTLTGTPNRNYDHASTERSTNSLVSRILFWGALCREFSKIASFPVP